MNTVPKNGSFAAGFTCGDLIASVAFSIVKKIVNLLKHIFYLFGNCPVPVNSFLRHTAFVNLIPGNTERQIDLYLTVNVFYLNPVNPVKQFM